MGEEWLLDGVLVTVLFGAWQAVMLFCFLRVVLKIWGFAAHANLASPGHLLQRQRARPGADASPRWGQQWKRLIRPVPLSREVLTNYYTHLSQSAAVVCPKALAGGAVLLMSSINHYSLQHLHAKSAELQPPRS